MTVLDNVKLAMNKSVHYSALAAVLPRAAFVLPRTAHTGGSDKLAEVVGLADKQSTLAKNLPYGQQRAGNRPRAGCEAEDLIPRRGRRHRIRETTELTELIHQIKEQFKLTVVLIEHDMSLVMKICERIYVMDYGRVHRARHAGRNQKQPPRHRGVFGED